MRLENYSGFDEIDQFSAKVVNSDRVCRSECQIGHLSMSEIGQRLILMVVELLLVWQLVGLHLPACAIEVKIRNVLIVRSAHRIAHQRNLRRIIFLIHIAIRPDQPIRSRWSASTSLSPSRSGLHV